MNKYRLVEKPLLFILKTLKWDFSSKKVNAINVFKINNPDYTLSPYSGLNRGHWLEAAQYLLEGAFKHIKSYDAPVIFPKQPGIGYPARVWDRKKMANAHLEGVCRTLFLAVPLLKENPDLVINKLHIKKFYLQQIAGLVASKNEYRVNKHNGDPHPRQPLVELGSLAIALSIIPEVLWHPLAEDVKLKLKDLMLSYGEGPTVPNNWRFFNIFILSFFKNQGYTIREELLRNALEESLTNYEGEGWYSDNPAFDYYSMWGFQTYSILWSQLYGTHFHSDIAVVFKNNFKDLADFYPHVFDRDGRMIMWGRSISYRCAAVAPLPFTGIYGESGSFNLGWNRHISSGTLLQFLRNPQFLNEGVPTLGFYGAFEPAVQPYNCRGSAYWLGKAFLGLLLPEENPYWRAIENEGPWKNYEPGVHNIFSENTGILVSNYSGSGASEIRVSIDHSKNKSSNPYLKDVNYNRLSYSSLFPWQADDLEDGTCAMNYLFLKPNGRWEAVWDYKFIGFENGFYKRTASLNEASEAHLHLSEKPIENGILRRDIFVSGSTQKLRLGHYALPELETPIKVSSNKVGAYTMTVIDNGKQQLAMLPFLNWGTVEIRFKKGLHPESKKSAVLNFSLNYKEPNLKVQLQTLFLWKESNNSWDLEELKAFINSI